MVRTSLAPATETAPPVKAPPPYRAGYWALLLLILSLPFELRERPLINSALLTLTNLQVVVYGVIGLALVNLAPLFKDFLRGLMRGKPDPANFFYRHKIGLGLFGSLLLAALLSSLLAPDGPRQAEGWRWTFDLLTGGILLFASLLWLAERGERDFQRLGLALVVGGVISAGVGFGEFIAGAGFAESLVGWFKVKPTTAGPFLRLSGTFEYANVAALYFELALPFALAGLSYALGSAAGKLRQLGWLIAIAILLEALLLTLTRGAWLGAAISLGVMAWLTRGNYSRQTGWKAVLGLTTGLGLLLTLLNFALVPQLAIRLNGQSEADWYKANYQSSPPPTLSVCQRISLPVRVENQGPLLWPVGHYNLSYHWLDQAGRVVVFEGLRTALTASIPPHGAQILQVTVQAPLQPGQYGLVWDMVEEEGSWFSLKRASYTQIPVQVTDLAAAQKAVACGPALAAAEKADQPFPSELPEVSDQPVRPALWGAALKMVLAHPLLGVGPGGFRLNYGLFASPVQPTWNQNIFANNLALEILADLGLVGGGLFLALVIVTGRGLLLALVGRVRLAAAWQVALVGAWAAFFGHGLVDYILGAHSINLLFWILLGLAGLTGRTGPR